VPKSIAERLVEFYRRLAAATPAANSEEALGLMCRILEEVEDDLSGIPKQAPPPRVTMFDGRLYPPLGDMVRRLPEGGIVARTRKHTIMIGANGSISILRTANSELEFTKSGIGP
jgi:hypothetical protein